MKKKIFITFLSGLVLGALYFSGPFVLAAIQSQVGLNIRQTSTSTWTPIRPAQDIAGVDANFNNVLPVTNLVTGTAGTPSIPASLSPLTFASSNVPAFGLVLNDSPSVQTATLVSRSTGYVDPCLSCTILPTVPWLFDGTNQTKQRSSSNAADALATVALGNANNISFPFLFNGTTFDRSRSSSATNLTATTSVGIPLQVPLSTWSVTNTPGAAAQATASKAAGGGTVRHVATTITACSAQSAAAQTPIAINLRDGATGAGTVLRTWKISSIIQDSKCVESSGLAMIGTANTAMTIEFAAAGVAGSEQTVTLTGFSVP